VVTHSSGNHGQALAYAGRAAGVPVTVVMFLLSRRFGALADRFGPRLFMGAGPLVGAAGLALMLRLDASVDYWTDLLPALLVFALGLSMTVAPLTATVLADAEEHNAGIASAVNNAIARVAGLIAIAAIGAVVAAHYGARLDAALGNGARAPAIEQARDRPFAVAGGSGRLASAQREASVSAFQLGVGIAGALVGLGGVLGLAGIRNPRREVEAAGCSGGQFVGAPADASRQSPCDWHRHGELPLATVSGKG
jgi:MFS family permease